MKRDYKQETESRVAFIQGMLRQAGANGVVFGNSGGKDSALVGILCKMACPNTLGVLMPQSKRNYGEDTRDALELAEQFDIDSITIDLGDVKRTMVAALGTHLAPEGLASANISPRLRMTALYAIAQSGNRLVAGTGNRSESYMGYFTKWGDGAYDFNPIADLTVTEIYEYLDYLNAPSSIRAKPPSAALFDGQTDEEEMGITYSEIDRYLLEREATPETREKIEGFHRRSEHKRRMPTVFSPADTR